MDIQPPFGGLYYAGVDKGVQIGSSFATSMVNTWIGNLVAPVVRAGSYNAEQARPNLLPAPEAVFAAWRRGLLSDDVTAQALSMQGIMPVITNRVLPSTIADVGSGLDRLNQRFFGGIWDKVSQLGMERPGFASLQRLRLLGRISEPQYDWMTRNLYVDRDAWKAVTLADYSSPDISSLLYLKRLTLAYGGIGEAQYNDYATRAGWTNPQMRYMQELAAQQTLSLGDLVRWYYRSPEAVDKDTRFAAYASAAGWTSNTTRAMALLASKPMPGPGDLISFAVREVWDPAVVQRWGYDDDFPQELAYWMGWQGMNWGQEFTTPDGRRNPAVTWPQAYWRQHWKTMPLLHAYRAFGRFRPERMYRYTDRYPNIQTFSRQHLEDVIKVADYPPKMRDWLAALANPILPIMSVRMLFRYGLRNRAWALQQLLDRSYVREDADAMLDLLGADEQIALKRNYDSIQRGVLRETVAELRTAYRMGGIDSATLHSRLTGLGFPQGFQDRVAALEDAKAARENLVVFIRQLRRSYLTGALTDVEVQASLTAARLAPQAIARYLRLWSAELTVERRSLSTAQLIRAVSAGQLAPAIAAVRLGRLGWTAPDAALLLQQAADKLTQAQAKAAQAQVHQAQQQAKALLQARKAAAQAQQSAQSRLRRIYPLAALKRQFCLGIRKEATIRVLLSSQGYDRDAIDGLLKQWVLECEKMPPAEPTAVKSVEAYTRRQTPLGTVKRWYQNGIVTRSWTQRRLATAGFAPESISGYLREWDATLGKKPGPAPEGAQAALP